MPQLKEDCIRVTHPCAGRQQVLLPLLPLDLHVLSLPLAFILSQDQTLHCMFEFILTCMHSCISYRNYILELTSNCFTRIKPGGQSCPLSFLLQYFKELSVYLSPSLLVGFYIRFCFLYFLKGCKDTHVFHSATFSEKYFFRADVSTLSIPNS